jgi:hypothetical protein
MLHINHIRNIQYFSSLTVDDVINNNIPNSFGTFCGSKSQRNRIGLHKISRVFGNIGIIILHNDSIFEHQLSHIYKLNPNLSTNNSPHMFIANQINPTGEITSYYDPLYGLTESYVLDVLAPQINSGNVLENNRLRSVLSDYLSIMEYQFRKDPVPFGDYPYNLDLLYDLTLMSYSELQKRVISFLPDNLKISMSGRLSADGLQQSAYNAVLSFAQAMKKFLWTKRKSPNHTKLSIIDVVKKRQLISIYIPESQPDVLEYISIELQQLNNLQIPYLVIENGINLNSNQKLKNIFMTEHGSLPYFTGILAENTSTVIDQRNNATDLASLFSQFHEIFVFSCSSILAAQPFSEGIGNYYRKVKDHHIDTHREPFHFFSSHSQGNVQHEIIQRIVNPEELTAMTNGCLLCGKNYPTPVLVGNFKFIGEIL